MATQPTTEARPLCVRSHARTVRPWPRPYFGAVPYINAMAELSSVSDKYGSDPVSEIAPVLPGSNASTWRGADAKRIKAELRAL